MSVRFIVGRSGTGKTSYCIKAIVDALLEGDVQQPLILLVPEQATYQAERAILADKRIGGYDRLYVLSFDRLQFLLSGKNTARPGLSRVGRQMIVQRILRENKDKLKIFEASANLPGLGRQMADTIVELHQYAKSEEDIERLLGELGKNERNNLVALKFSDIGLIFGEYLKFIEGKYIDPDAQLSSACGAVANAKFVKGARLWVDGFSGFTTAELAILAELLKAADNAQIALCLDPSNINLAKPSVEEIDPTDLFYPMERTYAELFEIVKKSKLKLAEPVILGEPKRFSSSEGLSHIERNIFKRAASKLRAADDVRIVSAPSGRVEVQFAAREILRLVKEKNYRYRDIAVIASDINRYEHYVRAYFEDYGVPFFIDKRKPLGQHSIVELICSALQVITTGFNHSDIFAYLKTDLVPVERYEVDLLENYCLAFGITGSDWKSRQEWQFQNRDEQQFDEQRVNKVRFAVSEPLLGLREELCGGEGSAKKISAEKFTQVIFEFLDELGVRGRISEWIEEAREEGDFAAVEEHRQFYDKLVNVFDELVEVFGGQKMGCEDFFAIINSAFSQLALAFIPPTLDEVLVGSIERSRHPDLKAVFLLGATQKQFPVPVGYSGILSDNDRAAAKSADFELAATSAEGLSERQYLAYIAFTRPSEFLCITYPSVDDKGSAEVRSQFIDNLASLFEEPCEESIAGREVAIDKIYSKGELAELLCRGLGKDAISSSLEVARSGLGELLDNVCADDELGELGEAIVSAINYDNRASLDKRIGGKLFGKQIKSSVTKLGTYAACPYKYFSRYILELEKREEFKFEPLDVGVFYHQVLDALTKALNAKGKDFATIEDEELLEVLREQVARLVQTNSFISNFVRHSGHNAFIVQCAMEVLEDCAIAIAEMVRAGKFRPRLSEVAFGEVAGKRGELGEYELGLSGGRVVCLNGKIDRLDVVDVGGEKAAVVFDYKRRPMSFSWSKFYYGLDMQLAIYMLAVRDAKKSQCKVDSIAGAFYMPVEVSPGGITLDELAEKIKKFRYKARGIFNGEFAKKLDGQTTLKDSRFYNFYITKDGEPYGDYRRSGVLRAGDFEKVLQFSEKKVIDLIEEMLSGRIEVRPYRLSGKSPCSYCDYKAVCRFDWQINEYNSLESLGKLKVLENMKAGSQDKDG